MSKAVIIASRENRFDALRVELEARGIETVLLERESLNSKALLEEKAQELGKVDYLVISSLCDEKYRGKTMHDLSTQDYQEWKYYSLVQFYEINASIIKKMIANGGGVVTAVISVAGATPCKGECMNGAAGAALFMGIQCLAEESHEDGIYANAVALGALEDNSDIMPMRNDAEMQLHIPSGKLQTLEMACKSIADVMQSTSASITGNLINADSAFSCAYMREW